jgi:hypothetical protein
MTKQDWALLNSDYNRSKVDRTSARRYKPVQRGSMRVVRDLYRTESEQAEFVSAGLLVKLPGQRK